MNPGDRNHLTHRRRNALQEPGTTDIGMEPYSALWHGEARRVGNNPCAAPLQQPKPTTHTNPPAPDQQRLGKGVHEVVEVIFSRKERATHRHFRRRISGDSNDITTGAKTLVTGTIQENGFASIILGPSCKLAVQQSDHLCGQRV